MGKRSVVKGVLSSAAILLTLFIAGKAYSAQNPIRVGRLTISPGLGYAYQYDDNVFYENEDTQDDYLSIVTPSILVSYPGSRPGNFIQAGYTADFAFYIDLTENNWQRHSPFISMGYENPLGFYTRVSDNYTYSEDPYGSFNQYDQSNRFGIGEKTTRWDNLGSILLGYRFGERYFIEATYSNYLIRYDLEQDQWQDRIDHTGFFTLGYRVTPKTSLLASYRYTVAQYNEQNDGVFDPSRLVNWSESTSQDYWMQDFLFGVRFEPGGKISGGASAGYGQKNFENSFDVLQQRYEDTHTPIVSAYLTYQPVSRTSLTLNLQRSIFGSPDADSSSFINTLMQLSLSQQLFSYGRIQFTGNLLGGWNHDSYDELVGFPDKYFDRYQIVAGINAAYRFLTIGLIYDWQDQNASDAAYESSEYSINRVSFTVGINF